MTRRGLNFFSVPSEVLDILLPIASENGGKILPSDGKYAFPAPLESCYPNEREFWIVPSNEIRLPRMKFNSNFVLLITPYLKEDGMMMGSLSIKYAGSPPDFSSKFFSKISKRLKKEFKNGLWARNEVFGGETFYSNLWISPGAESWCRRGGKLLPQTGDGNVTYSLEARNS